MCGSCSRRAGAAGGVDFMWPLVTELCCCFYRVAQTPCDRQMEREVMTHTDTRFSTAVTKRDKGLKHGERLREPETLHFFSSSDNILIFQVSSLSLFFKGRHKETWSFFHSELFIHSPTSAFLAPTSFFCCGCNAGKLHSISNNVS